VAASGSTRADEQSPTSAGGRRLAFRPDIEGLRAVAVGMVVVLHAGVTKVSGGYVGVDVFFVISGFRITSLLIDESRSTGRVSIVGFYARRARRILPAACFVIVVTVIAAYLQLGSVVGQTTAIDGRWAAAFAANFRFIHQGTDYFATNLPPSPLQHYWSLAVEEQFYLAWPTLMFGLVLLGRRFASSIVTVRLGLAAIVAGSLFWSIHVSASQPTTAYFSPFTRAWELGAGALIAAFSVLIAEIPALVRAIATWVGIALVAIAAFTFTATTVFPGYTALLPVVGAGSGSCSGFRRCVGSAGSPSPCTSGTGRCSSSPRSARRRP
jgi:peptidoglycan/LPS O-acetylase OafA/YrhL